jgi:hypothetical protein
MALAPCAVEDALFDEKSKTTNEPGLENTTAETHHAKSLTIQHRLKLH